MGRQPLGALRPHRPRGDARPASSALFDRLGVTLDPDRPARGLSIADQQLVEIAKALSLDARVLIMDEPTAALSGPRSSGCSRSCATLRERGRRGPVHLAPARGGLRALPDAVTVMRDGAVGRTTRRSPT